MNKIHKHIFAIFLMSLIFSSVQQSFTRDLTKIDSLKQSLNELKEDTNKVNSLYNLSKYYLGINMDTSLIYAEQALDLSTKISYNKGLYSSFNIIGIVHYYQGSYGAAIEYYTKALEIAEKIHNTDYIIACFTNIGIVHEKQGLYDKAIDSYLKALKKAEKINNKNAMAKCYNSIGIVYSNQGSFNKANEYYFKALKIKEELKDKEGMAESFNNIGVVYRKQESYDKAIEYYQKALNIYKELDQKRSISLVLNNISIIYSIQKKYNKAIEYILESLKTKEQLNDKKGMITNYQNLGTIYKEMGSYDKAMENYLKRKEISEEFGSKWDLAMSFWSIASLNVTLADSVAVNEKQRYNYLFEAIENGNKSLELAREIGAMYLESDVAQTLMIAYKNTGNYKKAIGAAEVLLATQDSMFSKDKTTALQEMETKYETEKKEKEIQLLNQEKVIREIKLQRSEQRFLFTMVAAGLLLIIIVLLYFQYRNRKRTAIILEDKNKQLNVLNNTKDRFISIIAHDLRNPFSAFRNIADALHENLKSLDQSEISYYTGELKQSSAKMHEMLKSLLEWAKLQKDSPDLETETVFFNEINEKAIDFVSDLAKVKNIQIENKVDQEINLKTNKNAILTVLNNLLTNAIKYSEKESTVSVTAETTPEMVSIAVSDQGMGMSKEETDKLFRIDVDTKTIGNSAEKGTGMGLILCKELLEKLGGDIQVESAVGKGSTFIFSLPLN